MTRDADIARIAAVLDGNGVACELHGALRNYKNAHEVHARRLYDAGLRSSAEPAGVERHPLTGAPMCCCLGGKEPCDHHDRSLPTQASDSPEMTT